MSKTEPGQDELSGLVAEGAITEAEAALIRARRAAPPAAPEAEPFRLVSSFGDVFLCIGLTILFFSYDNFGAVAGLSPLMLALAFAAIFWLLAELFTFGLRKKFPAVFSSLFFIWIMGGLGASFAEGQKGVELFFQGPALPPPGELAVIFAASLAALIRFRLPLLVLAAALSATLLAYSAANIIWPGAPALLVLGASGAALLAGGIYLDRQDPERKGPQHEWALWLFVTGSPLTVHPVFLHLIGAELEKSADTLFTETALAWQAPALAFGFILLSLLLDRRSLAASTLIYLSAAMIFISVEWGVSAPLALAVAPLVVGSVVIFLGVAWSRLRRALLYIIPAGGIIRPAS